jgi:undecaprenyl-diphosphatase
MIGYGQALFLGLIQGITELFPVSSLGHSVIVSGLAGWTGTNNPENLLVFLVATHFATAIVLICFFGREWLAILAGLWHSLRRGRIETATERLGWLIVTATIPAGVIGFILQKKVAALFVSPRLVAGVLVLNGLLLAGIELYIRKRRQKNEKSDISKLSFGQAVWVGITQVLALVPGFSRTGMTMGGGIFTGLNREDALRFSFLLSGPIILAAAVLKLPALAASANRPLLGPSLVGALAAAVASWFAATFLSRYFKNNTLIPFAIYCIVAGLLAFFVLA